MSVDQFRNLCEFSAVAIAVDASYDLFWEAETEEQLHQQEKMLLEVDPEWMPPSVALSILTATANNRLYESATRDDFYHRCRSYFYEKFGVVYAGELLEGLE